MNDGRDNEDEHGQAVYRADGQGDTAAFFHAEQEKSGECREKEDSQDEFWKWQPGLPADILMVKRTLSSMMSRAITLVERLTEAAVAADTIPVATLTNSLSQQSNGACRLLSTPQ